MNDLVHQLRAYGEELDRLSTASPPVADRRVKPWLRLAVAAGFVGLLGWAVTLAARDTPPRRNDQAPAGPDAPRVSIGGAPALQSTAAATTVASAPPLVTESSTQPIELSDTSTAPTAPAPTGGAVSERPAPSSAPEMPTITYVIKSGDYPLKVAAFIGCEWAEIAAFNDLDPDPGEFPYPGVILRIPPSCSEGGVVYLVKSGDSPWQVEASTGCRWSVIADLNVIKPDVFPPAGTALQLPAGCTPPEPAISGS